MDEHAGCSVWDAGMGYRLMQRVGCRVWDAEVGYRVWVEDKVWASSSILLPKTCLSF